MMKLLLTHTMQAREQYYGAACPWHGLRDWSKLVLHEATRRSSGSGHRDGEGLRPLIIADRATPIPAEVFASRRELKV